jgi:hypothetical protein
LFDKEDIRVHRRQLPETTKIRGSQKHGPGAFDPNLAAVEQRREDQTWEEYWNCISFCYTAEMQFLDSVPTEEVLKVAQKYAIDHLQDVCAKELTKNIDNDSLPQMLKLAKR